MQSIVDDNLASVRAAEELEIALLEQRGFVASFIMDDGDESWLAELARREPAFAHWLAEAHETAKSAEERRVLGELELAFRHYDAERDRVVALYRAGDSAQATRVLLRDMTAAYDRAYLLCEELIVINNRLIAQDIATDNRQLQLNILLASLYVLAVLVLGLGLAWIFFHSILLPLKQMDEQILALSPGPISPTLSPLDELQTLGFHLDRLMSDIADTRSDLERNRDRLLMAEKLASVGKLAACVAHEMRNPLTAVKMRLFSLRRDLGENDFYEDDLQVVFEEIVRLEKVIRHFLEFSRPPDLRLGQHQLARVMDKTLELGQHRLEEKGIRLLREEGPLPPILADAEQLMQVFLNLLINAAEAMPQNGVLRLHSSRAVDESGKEMVVSRFVDSGTGIDAQVRERIFEPFFSTKDSGTGLGLCIAASIMSRHNGRLHLESSDAKGTTFAAWIPAAEQRTE